jgi:sec-independent protein translocase protein TatA
VFAHWWELGIILILALVFFGPKRLPEIGSSMGKGIREFRKATTELEEKVNGDDQQPSPLPAANQSTSVQEDAKVKDVKEA